MVTMFHYYLCGTTTTFTNAPLSGPLLPIRSSPKSSAYVKLFLGRNTSPPIGAGCHAARYAVAQLSMPH